MTIQKTHQYKVFTPAGVYLGLLPDPSTPFNYNQNLSTTFAQLQITVPQSADVAQLANEAITDEAGNIITDEANNALLIERQPDIVGSTNSKALIANNNLIQVWEYSNYYPNGLQVFSGYISKWKTTFGTTDDIQITCLSQGNDMNNVLVTSGDTTAISNATDNGSSITSTINTPNQYVAQTFSPGSAFQISAVSLELTATAQAQVIVRLKQQIGGSPQPNSDPALTGGTAIIPIQTKTVSKISFGIPVTLNPALTYYMEIIWDDNSNLTIFASNAQSYGAGNVYTYNQGFVQFSTPALQAGYSLYFVIWQYGGGVTGAFSNEDPSFILTSVIKNYISQGGKITTPVSTIGALFSQTFSDTSIPAASWSTAISQIVTPTANMTLDTIQVMTAIGPGFFSPTISFYGIFKGDPSLDTDSITGGTVSYILGGSNSQVAIPAVKSTTANGNNGLVTINFASSFTLTAGVQYYIVFLYGPSAPYLYNLAASSTLNAAPVSPFGAVYTAELTFNNSSALMTKPTGIQALYMVLGLGAGASPNGGYSITNTLATYTFKMQTVLQAIQAIFALAPANWYWYVDPATSVLNFAQANTVADFTIIRGRHINEIDIEATKENIKNIAYLTGGDDGTGTSTNILVKVTNAQGSDRAGLVLLSDNRVNSASGSTVTAKLIAQNYLNNHASETYITNTSIEDQTMDINLIKLGMMCGFSGFGNFVDSLLLQVVGVNRQPDQIILQLGTLPLRDSQQVAALQAQLQYLQTVAIPSTPS